MTDTRIAHRRLITLHTDVYDVYASQRHETLPTDAYNPHLPTDLALAHQWTRLSSTDGHDLAQRLTRRFPKTRHLTRKRIQPTHQRIQPSLICRHALTYWQTRHFPKTRHLIHRHIQSLPIDAYGPRLPTDMALASQRTQPLLTNRYSPHPPTNTTSPTNGHGLTH
jgi:hypothetical protein